MAHISWSKGHTKDTHPSVRKISETMKKRKVDNFAAWREQAKKKGKFKSVYKALPEGGDLAELIGVILGDGHIQKFPRTERLLIFSNANNPGFVKRYADIVERLFEKKPYVYKQTSKNCIRISLYEKHISQRLKIPTGARGKLYFSVPRWVMRDKTYVKRYLRGLYEAEGSLSFHSATYTHKFIFSNRNVSLLKNVERLLKVLGFSPHSNKESVQLSRKDEVKKAAQLLRFRVYK